VQPAALEQDATMGDPAGHWPAGAHLTAPFPASSTPTQHTFVVRSHGMLPHIVILTVTGVGGGAASAGGTSITPTGAQGLAAVQGGPVSAGGRSFMP
jgi:hypothetical protein